MWHMHAVCTCISQKPHGIQTALCTYMYLAREVNYNSCSYLPCAHAQRVIEVHVIGSVVVTACPHKITRS